MNEMNMNVEMEEKIKNIYFDEKKLNCSNCKNWIPFETLPSSWEFPLPGDHNYQFFCATCVGEGPGSERYSGIQPRTWFSAICICFWNVLLEMIRDGELTLDDFYASPFRRPVPFARAVHFAKTHWRRVCNTLKVSSNWWLVMRTSALSHKDVILDLGAVDKKFVGYWTFWKPCNPAFAPLCDTFPREYSYPAFCKKAAFLSPAPKPWIDRSARSAATLDEKDVSMSDLDPSSIQIDDEKIILHEKIPNDVEKIADHHNDHERIEAHDEKHHEKMNEDNEKMKEENEEEDEDVEMKADEP